MTDLSPRPETRASSPLARLHGLCRDDYQRGAARRSLNHLDAGVRSGAANQAAPGEPSDLAVAIRLAQLTLASTATADHGDHGAGSLRESLRILLRALDAEPLTEDEAVRRSVDRAFPIVAAFLAAERGEDQ
ncbi:hypothetical protein [Streptomyces europaeiscabiei]|uniref:hypothetical protein n=1 Tax=Streptomyces europaeiscabiei TaxID=146819 RepID=UPI002E182FD0